MIAQDATALHTTIIESPVNIDLYNLTPISHTSELRDTMLSATYEQASSQIDLQSKIEDSLNIEQENVWPESGSDSERSGSSDDDVSSSYPPHTSWSVRDQPITTDPTTADLEMFQVKRLNGLRHSGVAESIYTGGSDTGLDITKKVRLTVWFVQNILKDLGDSIVACESQLGMASLLLTYQKVLRLRSTCELERTVTRFIRRRRANIAEMMASEQLLFDRTQNAVDLQSKLDALWPPFSGFFDDPNLPPDRPQDIDLTNLDETELEYDTDSPELDVVKRFLFDGHEYPWLIARIRRECELLSTGDTSSLIRRDLTHGLGSSGDLSLKLHWDPVAFMREQFESCAIGRLADVVCIVGTGVTAYAATCSNNLGIVWPDLGHTVLRFLDAWISEGAPDSYGSPALRDLDVNCHISLSNGWLSWNLSATATELVVEACEIICFLFIVCRTSRPSTNSEPRLEACVPQIVSSESDPTHVVLLAEAIHESLDGDTEHSILPNGACWRSIFWNPVIAVGYPIPARDSLTRGLQISIELFGKLTHISRALIYDGTLMLKGFCNMLVPTEVVGTAIIWHYLMNEDFAWMSHNRAEEVCGEIAKIDFQVFEAATTHFIGWVTSSQMNTGRITTGFDAIEYTGDDIIGSGYAIDGLTINVAKYLGASIKFTPAQKDSRLLHAPVPFYERMVDTARSMHVIFYDTTTRRAWLVGGDDALLYLSRAAISHPEGRTPRCHKGSPPHERFKHSETMNPNLITSQDVLLNEDNRDLMIYDNKRDLSKRWRFEDEVGAMFDVLGEMEARRAKNRSCETKQWEMKKPWSKQFVGIGCLDLISGQRTLRPRCRDLKSNTTHWLKMADAIDSVNIIGAGLAEMIQPTTKLRSLAELPTCQDILVACTERISRIARNYGKRHPDCVEITRGVFWQDPMASFHANPCRCDPYEALGCCGKPIVSLRDRRQTFLRGLRDIEVPLKRLLELYPSSAVAFSSNSKMSGSHSTIATRTSSALHQFLHLSLPRDFPRQPTNASFIAPGAPPTPEHSPLRITQPCDQASGARTAATNRTICTTSKAAQIWLLLMVGRRREAESVILTLLKIGVTAENIDEICFDRGHASNVSEDLQESLLGFAARSGDLDFARFLLQMQFPVNKTNSLDVTPLEQAASKNHVRVIRELLVSHSTGTEMRLNKALMVAVRAGDEGATELLLEYDVQLDAALEEACNLGHVKLVHLLIMNGADPNFDYARVFRNALANGSADLVEALLQHDVDHSLVLAMAEAMENCTPQPDKLGADFCAKLSHLKRKCTKICALDDTELFQPQEGSGTETP